MNKPVMLWDGDCGFCARWIKRWQRFTAGKVEYIPYQSLEADEKGRLKKFPALFVGDCEKSVQLVLPDGSVYSGAEAVFRSLAIGGKKGWLRLYRRFPGFQFVSEKVYRLIANHRPFFSKFFI